MNMETVFENESFSVKTETPLSEVSGPGLLTKDVVDTPPRLDDQGIGDTFAWTTRLIDWTSLMTPGADGISFGPGSASDHIYSHVLLDMLKWQMHKTIASRYYGFSYKAIKVRVTLSNPKNLVGACVVGWYPYVDYYDESPVGTFGVWTADSKSQYALYNSSDSQLLLYGAAQDISMTIPWTFKFPMFTTEWQRNLNETSQDGRPPYGSPMIYVSKLEHSPIAVSDLPTNAYLRIYVQFEDLKYFGPQNDHFVSQSGAGAAMIGAAVGVAAEEGLSYFSSKIAEAAGIGTEEYSTSKPGNFDNPQAVQMSYFGDTTSSDFPQTRPIFKDGLPSPSVTTLPSISEFLKKPFLIGVALTSLDHDYILVNPTRMLGEPSACNLMTYFAMMSRYWRGGIKFHFVVAGHPLVETEFTTFVLYDDLHGYTNTTFDDAATHRTVRSGSYGVNVSFPYLNTCDYLPVVDPLIDDGRDTYSAGRLYFRLRVTGTMLDKEPVIPVYIFACADEDFKFYQPYPPGFYNVEEIQPPPVQGIVAPPNSPEEDDDVGGDLSLSRYVGQVGLPLQNEAEIANLRGVSLPDPGILVPVDDLASLMKIWSRAIPFYDYNNDGDEEPLTDARVGFQSPAWFPPVDRARYYEDQNSWYCTSDYIQAISILFLYWRGTMGFKVVSTSTNTTGYMYVALSGIDDEALRTKAHSPFTQSDSELPPNANFGTGSVATPRSLQPVLEVSIPYRGSNVWSNVIWNSYSRGVTNVHDPRPSEVRTNVQLANNSTHALADSMYRKIDDDFALCVPSTLPPPAFWLGRGFPAVVPG